MTKLSRAVERETTDRVFSAGQQRAVIIGLEPGNLVTVRLKGERRKLRLPAASIHSLALKAELAAGGR